MFDHIKKKQEEFKKNLTDTYIDHALAGEIVEKGGQAAILGEKRTFNVGGKPIEHIKTRDGWKRVPKSEVMGLGAGVLDKEEYKQDLAHTAAPKDLIIKENQVDSPKVDINERFQAFARFTKAVIKGAAKSLVAYGTGGVGKTYTVTHQMDIAGLKQFDEETHAPAFTTAEQDDDDDGEGRKSTDYDYVKITGKMTGPQVYKTLYQHNGKIILFDDCDSVLRDSGAINLFKGGLDSSGDGTISWGTSTGVKDEEGGKVPNRFKFHGRVIFVSNLPSSEVPQPIKSRALRADLSMTPEQTIERLRFIAKDKEGNYKNLKFPGVKDYKSDDLKNIIDYLDEHKNVTSDLNVRTVGSLLAIKQIADEEGHDWKKDASHMIFSKSKSTDVEEDLTDVQRHQKNQKERITSLYSK